MAVFTAPSGTPAASIASASHQNRHRNTGHDPRVRPIRAAQWGQMGLTFSRGETGRDRRWRGPHRDGSGLARRRCRNCASSGRCAQARSVARPRRPFRSQEDATTDVGEHVVAQLDQMDQQWKRRDTRKSHLSTPSCHHDNAETVLTWAAEHADGSLPDDMGGTRDCGRNRTCPTELVGAHLGRDPARVGDSVDITVPTSPGYRFAYGTMS